MMTRILSGHTYSQCSVLATAPPSPPSPPSTPARRRFDLVLSLEGWREEAVLAVINQHFSHSPNKVLALRLKLSQSQRTLLNCPLLAQLACLAYEDTGELPGSSSESLHGMMRTVLRRELYTAGRTLHDNNYDRSLVSVGSLCLHSLARGRAFLRQEELGGLGRKYRQTLLGFLTARQSTARRDKQRREVFEPLHRAMMEFTAAFYLKSLSQSNQQDQLGREVGQLFEKNCESTENILALALEMLAPDNACSDILTRIPQQVGGSEVGGASLVRQVRLGEEEVGLSVPSPARPVLDLQARLRLLQTAGFTTHHVSSLLTGLEQDKPPVISCQPHQVLGWSNVLELRPDLLASLELSWRPHCPPLSQPGLERLFHCLAVSRLSQISLSLTFSPHLSQTDPAEELRQAGHLLGLLTNSPHLSTLRLEVEGETVNLFPLLDSLAGQVKVWSRLARLELKLELNSRQLSQVCSGLQSSPSLSHLSIAGARPGQGWAGFKQLSQLVRSGKIKILQFSSSEEQPEEQPGEEAGELDSQYVYEEEALISEEWKLRQLSPLLAKITGLAGLRPQEVSPVEISAGKLHPCLRWARVHPLPLCSGQPSPSHYISQALGSQHTATHHLDLTITDNTEILCLADGLVSNCSLRSLKLSSRAEVSAGGGEISLCFPLLLGVSSHLGLTNLDLSGLQFSLDAESLQLSLAALASNTALSLEKLNIAGWSFCCQITEKTNMMRSLAELFRTSRISQLDLSHCRLELSCNTRQFSLYFEQESEQGARSLWQDIHDDKISSQTLTSLNLAGVQMTINGKELFLPQELSMLDCPKLEVLNLSQRALDLSQPPTKCLHLYSVLENLPPSLLSSVQRLVLEHHCLQQKVPPSQSQELRDLLARLAELRELSLAGSWLTMGETGRKEDLLRLCLEWIPHLETLQLHHCYLSKEVGASLSRILKTRAKKGSRMKIGVRGCCGGGVEKMMTMINLSKFVSCQLDKQTGELTVQRV